MEGELQRILGDNVRAIRVARGLSQEKLGQVIGRDRTYVGSIERGERNLGLKTVERLADLLEIDPFELLLPRRLRLQAAEDGAPPLDARRSAPGRPRPPVPDE